MPFLRLLEQLDKQQNVGVSRMIQLIINFSTNHCEQAIQHLVHFINCKCVVCQPVDVYSTNNSASLHQYPVTTYIYS